MVGVDVQYIHPPQPGQLFIAPNPADDYLRLWVALERVRKVKLYDLSGRELLTEGWAHQGIGEEVVVDIDALPPGLYLVQVETNMGMRIGKVVKGR
jgi:hypothetical protein